MPQSIHARSDRYRLMRLMVAIVFFLLAHDAAMAAGAHSTTADHTSPYHQVTRSAADHQHPADFDVPQCGPSDGVMQNAPMLPTLPAASLLATSTWPDVAFAHTGESIAQPLPVDASALRAWLQVYLN